MKDKQKKQMWLGIIVLVIIISIFYFQTDEPLSVAYNNQCYLSSCPSGYSMADRYCEGKTCYGICEKPLPSYCGAYGNTKSVSRNIVVDKDDNNVYFSANMIQESPSKCYRYRASGQLTITNRDPGGLLYSDSESHEIIFGGAGMQDSICSTQGEFWGFTNWKEVGRGASGTGRGAYGKYISYKDTTCGSQSYGSEGRLLINLEYQEAPWIDNLIDTREVSCSFECSRDSDCGSTGYVGAQSCSGGNIVQDYRSNTCSSSNCDSSTKEQIVEFCDYGCESGSCIERNLVSFYRLQNDECSLVQIFESDKTQNDYSTLSECESHIQEQDILVYRLDDNCNSAYIKISQRTNNDYDTRQQCMSQQSQKVEYYRLEDDECSRIIIYPSERKSNDYSTLSECEQAITTGGDPPAENLTELILWGLAVLLLIGFLIVWLVKRK